jgi:ribosomal protein S18 acetylase RimI-like enzyme
MTEGIQLDAVHSMRAAGTEDEALLWRLFSEAKAPWMAAVGLDETQLWPLIEMQFRGRKMTYAAQFPNAADSVLLDDQGVAVGRLLVDRRPDAWRVVDIAILMAHRGKGLGTIALKECQRQCEEAGARLELQVDQGNPARRLYERLGFHAIREDAIAAEMVWNAPGQDRRDAVSE